MNMKKVIMATALLCAVSSYAKMNVSSGPIVPGEWNRNFAEAKQYAEAYNIPMVVFWANNGCSQCEKLEKSVEDPNMVAWMNSTKYVMVFTMGGGVDPQAGAAKDFIKSIKKLNEYPFIGVYWPKADGSVVKGAFVGRGSKGNMPVTSESELYANFIKSIETVLTGSSSYEGGGSGGGSGSAIPAYWNKSKTYDGYLHAKDNLYALEGVMTVKAGKANTKKSTAKLTVKVEMLGGAKKTFSGTINPSVASSQGVVLSAKDGDAMTIRVLDGGFVAEYGNLVGETAMLGGTLAPGAMNFYLQGEPTVFKDLPVVTGVLPKVVPFTVDSKGKKFKFEKGSVKMVDGVITPKSANPSGLKLTYNTKSGLFKGSFYLYTLKKNNKLSKKSVKVNGYVFNGRGYGWTTLKGLDSYDVQLLR